MHKFSMLSFTRTDSAYYSYTDKNIQTITIVLNGGPKKNEV